MQRVLLGSGLLVAVLALLGVVVAVYLVRAVGNIDRYDDLETDGAAIEEPRNYLVVGSDSREVTGEVQRSGIAGQRSDTIMVVRIDPATERAAVLALPRDLVVPISGTRRSDRINSAYAASRQTLIDTIRDNFDIEVNHYVEVDFQGFKRLVDAVGGIPLYLETAVKDTKSGLFVEDHGCVTLDGEQALAYARSRQLQYMTPNGWSRPDPSADLGRIRRQQVFIRRALVIALDAAKSNPLRLKDLIDIGTSSVGIDGQTDPMAMVKQFRDFDPDDLDTYSLPVVPRGDNATVALDEDQAEAVLDVFRGAPSDEPVDQEDVDDNDDVEPDSIVVTVLNGSQVDGQAAQATAAFEAAGFRTGTPADAPRHERTTVYYTDDDRDLALRVARHVEGGASIKVDDDEELHVEAGQVVVVTGGDFTGVTEDPTPVDELPEATVTPPPSVPAAAQPEPTEFTLGDPPPGVDCD